MSKVMFIAFTLVRRGLVSPRTELWVNGWPSFFFTWGLETAGGFIFLTDITSSVLFLSRRECYCGRGDDIGVGIHRNKI